MEFEKSETKKNLARLYAGECQDGARYQLLAQQAKTDKLFYMQNLLKILAKNEMAHAKIFYDLMLSHGGETIKNIDISAGYPFTGYDLPQGLKMASDAEFNQFDKIYPAFAKIAKDEGFLEIADAMEMAAAVEDCHSKQLLQLFEKLKNKKMYKMPKMHKWKCSKCGYEHIAKEAWKICPLCKLDQGYAIIPLDDN